MTDGLEAALRRMAARPDEHPADAASAERIVRRLESMPLPPQNRPLRWWPAVLTGRDFAPAWPRLAALAAAAVLGISIGLSGLGTRIATDLDLVRVASADDANVFDLDLGLRP
jgi:ferric-dicitrate binding protein FerR (iron transport regulator)